MGWSKHDTLHSGRKEGANWVRDQLETTISKDGRKSFHQAKRPDQKLQSHTLYPCNRNQ